MTRNYAAPGTPDTARELESLYKGFADIRNNTKAHTNTLLVFPQKSISLSSCKK